MMQIDRSQAHRYVAQLALLVVLAGCSAPNVTAPIAERPAQSLQASIAPARATSQPTYSLPSPTAIATTQPHTAAQTPAPDPVTLVREQDGIRLKLSGGELAGSYWLNDTQFLMHWSTSSAPQANATYLLDMPSGGLRQLASNLGQPSSFVRPSGQLAIICWATQCGMLDLRSGALETVYAHDPSVAQWAAAAEHEWGFGNLPGSFSVSWVGEKTFILTEAPADPTHNLRDWGKVILVDTAARRVRVLAKQGHLAAVFPDGSLLIRQGWMDGALQLFTPHGEQPPIQASPGGPWSDSWKVSSDGRSVAWLEWNPPHGDWSDHIPHGCCSGEPQPTISNIAIWNRKSQTLQRFPASDMRWAFSYLGWRANSRALLFSRTASNDFSAALFQLNLDGKEVLLAQHHESDLIAVDFEAPDRSLYYVIAQIGTSLGSFMHRDSTGRIETLAEMDFSSEHPLAWSSDHQGHLILRYGFETSAKTVVKDIITGRTLAPEEIEKLNLAAPGNQWVIESAGPSIHIRRKQ